MPYKISGTKNETARIIIFKESDWSIESNTVVSGSGDYEVDELESGTKTMIARSEEGEVIGYGHTSPLYWQYPGASFYGFGQNTNGELAQDDLTNRSIPVQIGESNVWKDTSCGAYHVLSIKADGTLWASGNNGYGQLGLGDTVKRSSLVQVGADTDWDTVDCGGDSTIAFKEDGSVWAWGNSNYNQLYGIGSSKCSSPVQISAAGVWSTMVVSGEGHTLGIKTDGTLWGWGRNAVGQVGVGTATNAVASPTQVGAQTDWITVAVGFYHSLGIRFGGVGWGWGYNGYGQIGNNSRTMRSSPVQIGGSKVWSIVKASRNTACGIDDDGSLWTWGRNNYGQLGRNDTIDKSSPVQVGLGETWIDTATGYLHTIGIKSDGSLWTWGYGSNGQLGIGSTTHKSSPVQVGSDTDWKIAEAEERTSFVIKAIT